MSIKKELLFLVYLTSACNIVAMEQGVNKLEKQTILFSAVDKDSKKFENQKKVAALTEIVDRVIKNEIQSLEKDYIKRINAIARGFQNKLNIPSQIQIKIKEDTIGHKGHFEEIEKDSVFDSKYIIVMDKVANRDFHNTIPFRLGKILAKIETQESLKKIGNAYGMITSCTRILINGENEYEQRAIDIIESYEGIQDYYKVKFCKNSIKKTLDLELASKVDFLINYAKKRGYPYRQNNLLKQLAESRFFPPEEPEYIVSAKFKEESIIKFKNLLENNDIPDSQAILSLYEKSAMLPGVFVLRKNNIIPSKGIIIKNLESIFGRSIQRDIQQERKIQEEKKISDDAINQLKKKYKLENSSLEPIRIDYVLGNDIVIEEYTFLDLPIVVQPLSVGNEDIIIQNNLQELDHQTKSQVLQSQEGQVVQDQAQQFSEATLLQLEKLQQLDEELQQKLQQSDKKLKQLDEKLIINKKELEVLQQKIEAQNHEIRELFRQIDSFLPCQRK